MPHKTWKEKNIPKLDKWSSSEFWSRTRLFFSFSFSLLLSSRNKESSSSLCFITITSASLLSRKNIQKSSFDYPFKQKSPKPQSFNQNLMIGSLKNVMKEDDPKGYSEKPPNKDLITVMWWKCKETKIGSTQIFFNKLRTQLVLDEELSHEYKVDWVVFVWFGRRKNYFCSKCLIWWLMKCLDKIGSCSCCAPLSS